MKKVLSVVLVLLMLAAFTACGHSDEETNAKSVLYDAEANYRNREVDIKNIKSIEYVTEQTIKNKLLTYFIVETDSYDWGIAELCDGEVLTYDVGFSKSQASTRCSDLTEYRTSELGAKGIN